MAKKPPQGSRQVAGGGTTHEPRLQAFGGRSVVQVDFPYKTQVQRQLLRMSRAPNSKHDRTGTGDPSTKPALPTFTLMR